MDFLFVAKQFLIAFFLINAVFWGLFPHSDHCNLASKLGRKTCAPHWVHVYGFGLLSFIISLYIKQGFAGFY